MRPVTLYWVFLSLLLSSPAYAVGEAEGVLQWHQKAELSLPVSGVIENIEVIAGQAVKQGATMLTLDKRAFQNDLKAAKARVAGFSPSRNEAENELMRAEELFDRTVLSQVELDRAKIDFAEKDARYLEARANLDQAKLNLEYTVLKAPFDLRILQAHVVVGQTVINDLHATPLFTVAKDELVAVLRLSAAKTAGLSYGSEVDVSVNGSAIKGRVTVMDYDVASNLTKVMISLNSQPAASVGQAVRVTWP